MKYFVIILCLVVCSFPGYAQTEKSPVSVDQTSADKLEEKFFSHADKITKNARKLKLSNEQVNNVNVLISGIKKELTERNAKLETLTVEANTLMWAAPADAETITMFAEEKNNILEEKEKFLNAKIRQLNSILSDKQKKRLTKL